MEPQGGEITDCQSVEGARAWAGVAGTATDATTLWGALVAALGGTVPVSVTQLARVPPADYLALLDRARVSPGATEARAFTILERGTCLAFFQAARRGAGLPYSIDGPAGPAAPATGAALALPPPGARKVKLSSVVDVTAEADIIPMETSELSTLFEKYREERGEYPHSNIEPTPDQLAALRQLCRSAAPPYADFSLFGAYGKRFLKRLMFTGFTYSVQTGEWQRAQLPGPGDFSLWWKSWMVYRTALLLLRQVKIEPLDLYGEHIRCLHETYGAQAWFLVYQADVRMRSEEFERIRRRLQAQHDRGAPAGTGATDPVAFEPDKPWNAVFHRAVHAGDAEAQAFWTREVKDQAFLFLTRLRTVADVTKDGTASEAMASRGADGALDHLAPPPEGGAQRANRKKRKAGPGSNQQPPPRTPGWTDHSGGAQVKSDPEVCNKYNSGICEEPCPWGRAHVCRGCGGPHPITSCPKGKGKGGPGQGDKGKGKAK